MINLLAERAVLVRLDAAPSSIATRSKPPSRWRCDCLRRKPSFSTMEFRDALGVSRKYAVPLLDYLDRVRFTVGPGT